MRDEENDQLEEIEFLDEDSEYDEIIDDELEENYTETILEEPSHQVSNQNIPKADITNSSLSSHKNTNSKLNQSSNGTPKNTSIPPKLSTTSNNSSMSIPKNMPSNKVRTNTSINKSDKGISGGQIDKKSSQSRVNSNVESNNKQDLNNDNKEKKDNSKSKEKNQDLKSKTLSAADDAKTAAKAAANITAGNKVEGAVDIAKLAWKHKDKIIKRWIIKHVLPVVAGFLAIILIFFMIMSPLIENIEKVKDFLGQTIEFGEKTSNLYSGLGFKTTDEAFFEELSDQFNLANGAVDLPLVMSALMYTETTNDYQTDYSIDKLDKSDSSISSMLSEVISDSTSEYTQGQILRARMLCKGMTEQTEGEKVTFDEFLKQYGHMLTINLKNMTDPSLALVLNSINPLAQLVELFKNTYNFVFGETFTTASGEFVNSLSELFETTTMGLRSITNISFGLEGAKPQIYVTMITKKYSEDNFKNFLSSYYIKKMPEFKPIINGLSGTALDSEIDRIIKEIYDHKSWYTDIYGDLENSSEEYQDTCVGAISQDLISELGLPIKVNSASITFNGEYAYGLTSAQIHNGVDLNSETTGTKEGDSVFAISIGEVVKVKKIDCNKETDESCDITGTYIKLKHSKMIDGTKYEFYSVYANLQAGSVTLKKGDKVKKGDVIGKAGKTGDATISQVHFEFHNENDTPIDPTNLFIQCSAGDLFGNSNEEKIWFYFRNLGYSEVATAAAMGNLSVESGLEPQRVQGTALGSQDSIDYTNKVDSGKISRNDFVHHGPGGGGYGLAQWTSSGRKDNLYSFKKKEKTSIGDLQMQLGYLMTEIDGTGWSSSSYKNTWKNAKKSSDLNISTTAFCNGFERPGVPHLDSRKQNAKDIYDRNKGKRPPSTSSVTSSNNSILASAKEIKTYISSNGYKYGALGIQVKSAKSSRTVDCSSYVSWVLFNAGYMEFGGWQQTDSTFYTNSWGFKEVKTSEVKPGDILIYTGYKAHVEIYAGMSGNTTKVYNAGSNNAIRQSGVTNSAYGVSKATKILRPSK